MLKTIEKYDFDPTNSNHIGAYRDFLQNNKSWKGTCPFKLEQPYESVPHMIESKVTKMYCEKIRHANFN